MQKWDDVIREQLNNLPGFPAAPSQTPPAPGEWVLGDWIGECHVRPEVANFAALPLVDNELGDVRVSLADQAWFIWDGAAWQPMAGGGGGAVNSVTASAPIASSGGANPNISLTGIVAAANGGTGLAAAGAVGNVLTSTGAGWASSALPASVTSVSGAAPLSSSGGTTPTISLTGIVAAANGGTGIAASGALGNVLTSNGAGGWVSSAPASTSPAAPLTSIQFNNGGAFGGSASLTWDGSTLAVDGAVDRATAGTLTVGGATATAITVGQAGVTTTFPGPVNLIGDVTTVGGTQFTTDAQFDGNVTFGNAASDNISFIGQVDTAITQEGIAAPAVSPAGTGRIYFDSGTNTFKASQNGGAYVDLITGGTVTSVTLAASTTGLTISGGASQTITTSGTFTLGGTLGVSNGGTGTSTAFTPGSVIFAGASGVYAQDNANLFWDDTNNRLGIGTSSPSARLHSVATNATAGYFVGGTLGGSSATLEAIGDISGSDFVAQVAARSSLSNGTARMIFADTTASRGQIQALQDTAGGNSGRLEFYTSTSGGSRQFGGAFDSSGRLGIGTSAPTSALSVGASSQFQVSSTGDIVAIRGQTTTFPAANAAGILTNNGAGTLSWAAAPAASLTVGTTPIAGGVDSNILFQGTGGVLQESTQFQFFSGTFGETSLRSTDARSATLFAYSGAAGGGTAGFTQAGLIGLRFNQGTQNAIIYADSAFDVRGIQNQPFYLSNVDTGFGILSRTLRSDFGGVVINPDSNALADFKVVGDNDANLVFVDVSADNFGISTAAPTTKFSVAERFQVNSTGNIVKINNVTTSFPAVQGSAGTVLTNDGSGNLSWSAAAAGTITGSGTATQIAYFTGASAIGSETAVGSNALTWDATSNSLGIGTAGPTAALDVRGSVLARNASDSTAAFDIQNAATASQLRVDTTNSKLFFAGVATTNTHTFNIGTNGTDPAFAIAAGGRIHYYDGTAPTNGQVLIGDTALGNFAKATITAGTGISVTNGAGSITIAATGAAASSSTDISGYVAQQALNAGDLVRFVDDAGTPKVQKADATNTDVRLNPVGFAVAAASAGAAVTVRVAGVADVPAARFDAAPAVTNVGQRVFVSTTSGQITLTAPSVTGDIVQRAGVLVDGGANPKVLVQIGDPILL